jgi:RNA polymerase sigma factor (sigma-70 family)
MNPDDAGLVKRVLAGEKSAFGILIDRYRPNAFKLARRILGDAVDAEDVIQEALIQAFLGLDSLRAPDRFGPWLLGIVVNQSRMRLRARRDWHSAEDWHGGRVPEDFTAADLQPSPEAIYEARELQSIVLAAIAALSADQAQAVRLHYVDGLTLGEIGRLIGVPGGAIKVRLHRARVRLRLQLEREFAGAREMISRADKEVAMIEVSVHDVMLRAPKGEEAEWLPERQKKYTLGWTRVVLLKEKAGNRIIPLWVGPPDGDALAMSLAGISTFRPWTFDLMVKLLNTAATKVEKVAVTSLRDDIYYATIWVKMKGRMHEVDARPSDALNLALRVKAPIFVTPECMEQAQQLLLAPDNIAEGLESIRLRYAKQPTVEMDREWKSFRSLPRGNAPWIKPAEK